VTKKDYIAIARELNDARPTADMPSLMLEQYRRDVHAIMAVLRRDNGRFDEARFLTACGL
jgi:hypothetical protein